MPVSDLRSLLCELYDRARLAVEPCDVRHVRRAFRLAWRALQGGDPRPAILVCARWA